MCSANIWGTEHELYSWKHHLKTNSMTLCNKQLHQCQRGTTELALLPVTAAGLQCCDTVGWASGRASGLQKLSDGVLVWLSIWSEVQIVCIWSQLMPLHTKPQPHLNPDWFYLSGTGLPRLSWKRGRKTGVVVVLQAVMFSSVLQCTKLQQCMLFKKIKFTDSLKSGVWFILTVHESLGTI